MQPYYRHTTGVALVADAVGLQKMTVCSSNSFDVLELSTFTKQAYRFTSDSVSQSTGSSAPAPEHGPFSVSIMNGAVHNRAIEPSRLTEKGLDSFD